MPTLSFSPSSITSSITILSAIFTTVGPQAVENASEWCTLRGPWRCGNLGKNMLSQFFEGSILGKIVGNSPLSRNSGQKERGQDEVEKYWHRASKGIMETM